MQKLLFIDPNFRNIPQGYCNKFSLYYGMFLIVIDQYFDQYKTYLVYKKMA